MDNFEKLGVAAARIGGGIESIVPDSRNHWLALRSNDITASAAGALFGVHDYQTPFGLWALKTGRAPEGANETAAMKRGRLLEPVVIDLVRDERPDWKISPNGGVYYRDPAARLGATPDAFIDAPDRDGRGVLQIKTTERSVFARKWVGDGGAIEPPIWIAMQALIEAELTGSKWAAVAVMTVGFGLDLHIVEVPMTPGLMDTVRAKVAEFWRMVDEGREPPADYARDGAALAQVYAHDDGSTIDLAGDNELTFLLEERARLSAERKAHDERLDVIRNEIIAKIGPHASATLNGWIISAKTITKKPYTVTPKPYRDIRPKRIA